MEIEVLAPVVESAPLWLNPLTWVVAFIIFGLAYEFFWGKHFQKSSPKSRKPNKTSYNVKYKNKPTYANSDLPKKKKSSTA